MNAFAYAITRLETELETITLEAQKADLVAKIARLRAEMHVEGIARDIEKNSKVPAITKQINGYYPVSTTRVLMGQAMTTKR